MGRINGDIFGGDSDSEEDFQTQNQYAKNYDNWRKKEELHKLKTKYGEDVLEESDELSSSSDDDDAIELTEEVEKDFFKTLSYLKKKDPKIYDNSITFFKAKDDGGVKKEKKLKEEPMYLKDYERKLLLEKRGILSDEEDEENSKPLTYAKEQQHIKEEIVKLGANIESDEEDDKLGGLLELRKRTKEEETEKEAEYLKWLTGQTEEMKDEETKTELKPLKDYWNDPNLDSGEKFLRDYVLKKRYLENDNEDYIPTYDQIIHDSDNLSSDEDELEKQEEFEHKYNFRFEEPDQEFIKRYPRTIEQSLRKTDDRRKLKRAEIKERKQKEKEEKMADIRKLQELKRKEIEEKIEKLKEVTGATELAFEDEDIDGDFDPEAHDRRMQALFNEEFYEGAENDQKPEFPELDKELEIENWDHWDGGEETYEEGTYEQHCEDEDFNMDADYDPSISTQDELIENSKGKKKRRRRSKVAEALNRPKPKFDPNNKNYEKYFDEYYKLECEDIIGDIPCRFKYREVIPNDFGLSIEEILLAKDKELNRWCSLKKTVQRRPENVEKYEQIAYAKKANNVILKKRLIPSLFVEEMNETEIKPSISSSSVNSNVVEETDVPVENALNNSEKADLIKEQASEEIKSESKKRKKKKAKANVDASNKTTEIKENGNKTKSKKKKKKKKSAGVVSEDKVAKENNTCEESMVTNKKKNRKRNRVDSDNNAKQGGKKLKKNRDGKDNIGISDARLSAFGINPKKYKNKLKYGNKSKN